MSNIIYRDFNLSIYPAKKHKHYLVEVLGSGGGDASASFSAAEIRPPFQVLENATSQISDTDFSPDRTFQLTVGSEQLTENFLQPLTLKEAKDFGRRLFQAVLKDDVYVALRRSLDRTRQEGSRLRLQLNLTQVPELAVLPWEFLFNERTNCFLAQAVESPIVRYLKHDEVLAPLTLNGPLRVLVMVAHLPQLPQLDVEREWSELKEAVRELEEQNLIVVERLDDATVPALQDRLMQRLVDRPYHVFHFIGHGAYNPQTGEGKLLVKQANSQEIYSLSAERLSTVLRNHNRTLRLVVLNSCEGARTSATDSYTGMAQSLLRQGGIPAIIAMQYKITDQAAITFTHQFYKALSAGYPVEAALSQARLAIYTDDNDVEWATPVLYLHASSGQLFDNKAARIQPPKNTIAHPLSEHYEAVIAAFREGKLVPFLGLDVNLYGRQMDVNWKPGTRLPCTRELADYLAQVFSYPPGEARDLVSVSQYAVVSKKGPVDLYDNLSLIFSGSESESKYEPTPLHYFLAQIPKILRDKGYPLTSDPLRHRFVVAVSTYDNLMESAFQSHVPAYHVVSYVTSGEQSGRFTHTKFAGAQVVLQPTLIDNPPYYPGLADQDAIILKLPGAVEQFEQRFAITEDQFADYLTYKDLSGLLPPQLKGKLKGSHHLFLGSNLRDWHLRALLYRIWESRRPQRASWAVHPDPRAIEKEFWKASGIEVIQADFETYIAGLEEGLRRIPIAEKQP